MLRLRRTRRSVDPQRISRMAAWSSVTMASTTVGSTMLCVTRSILRVQILHVNTMINVARSAGGTAVRGPRCEGGGDALRAHDRGPAGPDVPRPAGAGPAGGG